VSAAPAHRRPLVLVTSFEAFGGSAVNPTIAIARALAEMPCGLGARAYATLPVVTGTGSGSAWAAVEPLLDALRPDAVVALGESAKADRINLERVAVNLRDARIADNAGVQLVDAPVVAGGPDAYFGTLPVREMLASCESAGVAVQFSMSAGTFLCNELMYRLLHRAAARGSAASNGGGAAEGVPRGVARSTGFIAGFLHVPQLPEQAEVRGGPSMDAATSARGVHAALEVLAARIATGVLA